MSLDTNPDIGDAADLYEKMLAAEQTRDWKKWHEEHPYIPHPRPKDVDEGTAHRPRVSEIIGSPVHRQLPIPSVSKQAKLDHADAIERFRAEAHEISKAQYKVGSTRGIHFEEGYIAARLHAQGMTRPQAELLAGQHLGIAQALRPNQARAKREGVAAGYRMHALGPDRVRIEPSVSRVAEKPYDPDDKRTSGITSPDHFAVGDILHADYGGGRTIAKVTGKQRVTVTYEDGGKETFTAKSWGHRHYAVVTPGHDTPADRAGIPTSDYQWQGFNSAYRQEATKIADEALTTNQARDLRDQYLASAAQGPDYGRLRDRAYAQVYADAVAARNGLHTEDRTAGELRKGDVIGHVKGKPVRVASVSHPEPGRVILHLESEHGTSIMGEKRPDSGNINGIANETKVGPLAKAHVANVKRAEAEAKRQQEALDKLAKAEAIKTGSPKVPYTAAHFREAKRQVAELLLRQELTKQDSLADRRRAKNIVYHFTEHGTPGEEVTKVLADARSGVRLDSWSLGSKWLMDFNQALKDSTNAQDFLDKVPKPEAGAGRIMSADREKATQAALAAFRDIQAAESDTDAKAAVAAARQMANDIADDAPTRLNEDQPGAKWSYDALRQHVESQMGLRPFGASTNWRPGTNSMGRLGNLSVEDFARHAAVMEKGREIAARIDAHPEIQARRHAVEAAQTAINLANKPERPSPAADDPLYDQKWKLYHEQIDLREGLIQQKREAERELMEAYRTVGQEELARERPMDGDAVDKHPVTGTTNKIEAAFREALSMYPRQWIENSALGSHLGLKQASSRAHYQDRGTATQQLRKRGAPFSVSIIKTSATDNPTMVHEIGHRMEYTNDGLMRLEATHLEVRAPGEVPKVMRGYRREKSRPDLFMDQYAGKVYTDRAGPDRAHELFTMGMQSLFGKSRGYGVYGRLVGVGGSRPDPETRAFILGALALHANPTLAQ